MSLIDRVLPASFRENRLIAPQHLIVIQSILLIARLWNSSNVLPANMFDYVSDVVVLMTGQFSTRSHHNFITATAKVILVVHQEIPTPLHPHRNLVSKSIGGNANLHTNYHGYYTISS